MRSYAPLNDRAPQALSADGTPVLLDGLCARWLRDSAMFWRQRVASCRRLACEEVAGEQVCALRARGAAARAEA